MFIAPQQALLTQLEACTSTVVAFTALRTRLDVPWTATVNDGDPVFWYTVKLNQGGGYKSATGAFTCPVDGLYMFSVHVQPYPNTIVCFKLQKNGANLVGVFAGVYDTVNNPRGSGSISHAVHLRQGDVVRVVASCDSKLYSEHIHENSNYFTGHLIHNAKCNKP